jgi:uncharacterized protein YbjT (DUF2867 family)
MSETKKTAAVFGASGLVGSEVVRLLATDIRYEKVKLFTRRPLHINLPSVEEHIIDFNKLDQYAGEIRADHVFCCLGTTAKKTPDKKIYENIDLYWPATISQVCKRNGSDAFAVISSIGANPDSSTFYLRTKGLMEKAVLQSGVSKIIIVRPSFLLGRRAESRFGEGFAISVAGLFSFLMVGPLKKYKPIQASEVARAMIFAANHTVSKSIFESHELLHLV